LVTRRATKGKKIEYLHCEKTGPPGGTENEKGNKHKNEKWEELKLKKYH